MRARPRADLAQSESVFALANGHIGLRANLDEGEPHDTPGTYLNGFYEERPLPYAETAYGLPDAGQTIVNVTNGKVIRLLVDDEQFDVRYGDLLRHERVLDLREGVLTREVDWRAPTGREVRVRATRLVSFAHRSVAAIEYVVEAVGADTRITVQSELVANEPVPIRGEDPRAAGGAGRAAGRRAARAPRAARRPDPQHPGSASCGWRPPWTTWSRGPRAPSPRSRPSRTWRG